MLTKCQDAALKKCMQWLELKDKQVFRLYGSAGSGKSFLIGKIVEACGIDPSRIAFCAPTGKAATVLMQRYAYPNVSTLHHLIYIPYSESKLVLTSDNEIDGIESTTSFMRKDALEGIDLVVLDEVSMVDREMMSDLLSYGKPVLAVGDPFQLPPINDKALDPSKADALLTEVVRQAAGNPIIALSEQARNGLRIKEGNYGNAKVISKQSLSKELLMQLMLSADQVICGLNCTRRRINKEMREKLGFTDILPEKGDKLICKSNEYGIMLTQSISLCNGMTGYAESNAKTAGSSLISLAFKTSLSKQPLRLLSDSSIFTSPDFKYEPHWLAYKMRDDFYEPKRQLLDEMQLYDRKMWLRLKREEAMNKAASMGDAAISRLDYAYAISCHASQGSEFPFALVINEADAFRQNASRWLYTAMTRAKEKLVVIQ